MLVPFLVLCIDLLFSSIEYIFLLDVEIKVALFENIHIFFEYFNEVIELCHLLFQPDEKLLNFFHGKMSFARTSTIIASYSFSIFWMKDNVIGFSCWRLISNHWTFLYISWTLLVYTFIIPSILCFTFSSNLKEITWNSWLSKVCSLISYDLSAGTLLETFYYELLHSSNSSILTCKDSMLQCIWDSTSKCFSKVFHMSTIFCNSSKYLVFTSCRSYYSTKMLSLSEFNWSSNFLFLFTLALKLIFFS